MKEGLLFLQSLAMGFSVNNLATQVHDHTDEETRAKPVGGVFIALHVEPNGHERMNVMPIGELDEERRERCRAYAMEKIARLRKHPEHSASYLSRDPDQEQWGGAIRVSDYLYFAYSHYSEHADECYCLAEAVRHGLMSGDQAFNIAQETGNTAWMTFLQVPEHANFRPETTWWTVVPTATPEGNICFTAYALDDNGRPTGEPLYEDTATNSDELVMFMLIGERMIGMEEVDPEVFENVMTQAMMNRTNAKVEAITAKTLAAFPKPVTVSDVVNQTEAPVESAAEEHVEV